MDFENRDKKICEYVFIWKIRKSLSQEYLEAFKNTIKSNRLQGIDVATSS
jgi:hypothetical protein